MRENRICCICQQIVRESVAIDVSDEFNLREGLAFVCGQVCKSLSITLTYPYNYSEVVSQRQAKRQKSKA